MAEVQNKSLGVFMIMFNKELHEVIIYAYLPSLICHDLTVTTFAFGHLDLTMLRNA